MPRYVNAGRKNLRLTVIQAKFIAEFIKNGGNATQAYLKASPNVSKGTAITEGKRMLKRPHIASQIDLVMPDPLSKEALEADITWAKDTAKSKEDYLATSKIAMDGAKLRGLLVDKHVVEAVPQSKIDEIRRLAIQEAIKMVESGQIKLPQQSDTPQDIVIDAEEAAK